MIRVKRSSPAPDELAPHRRSSWRARDVRAALHRDFFEKCYLCEGPLRLGELQVDHRVPRRDPSGGEREYDWENLFPAHGDCNNRRPRAWPAEGLLFPDKDDVEGRLVQELRADGKRVRPVFLARDPLDAPAKNTADELQHLHVVANPQGSGADKADDLRAAIKERYDELLHIAWRLELKKNRVGAASDEARMLEDDLRVRLSRRSPYTMLLRSKFPEYVHLFD